MSGSINSKVAQMAMKDKDVAMAILGQAIIDEGAIGADGTIIGAYTSRKNAEHLWKIADKWGLVHPLRTKKYATHTKWCVSLRADKRFEVYDAIGPLPDAEQDKMFRHTLRNAKGGADRSRTDRRRIILEMPDRPLTVRQIAYTLDLSASPPRRHLRILNGEGKIAVIGTDKKSFNKNQRTAQLWQSASRC